MHPEIRAIIDEKELNRFLPVITRSFSTVSEEFGLTKETAPSNPAFLTIDKLVELFVKVKCFGLYLDDQPVGFFGIEISDKLLVMIEKISVMPEVRHRGYGKLILDFAVNFAESQNLNKLSVAIINKNNRLKNWYTKYGFKESNIAVFPQLPFEVCFMELKINSADV